MTLESFHLQIRLEPKQWKRFQEFAERCNPPDPYEEDCAGPSPFTWVFQTSGIGTSVWVYYGDPTQRDSYVKDSVDLTLDDGGEFLHGWGEEV